MQDEQRDSATGGMDARAGEERAHHEGRSQLRGDNAQRDDDDLSSGPLIPQRKVDDLESSLRDGRDADWGEVY